MTVGVVIGRSPRLGRLPAASLSKSEPRSLIRSVVEVWRICSRVADAARAYEELAALSDAGLAKRGLRRSDVPRAALRVLTEG